MNDPVALALAGTTVRRMHDATHGHGRLSGRRSRRLPTFRPAAPRAPQLATDQLAPQC